MTTKGVYSGEKPLSDQAYEAILETINDPLFRDQGSLVIACSPATKLAWAQEYGKMRETTGITQFTDEQKAELLDHCYFYGFHVFATKALTDGVFLVLKSTTMDRLNRVVK